MALLKTISFSKTLNTVIEFGRQNKFFQINTPISFLFEKLPQYFFSMILIEPEADATKKK